MPFRVAIVLHISFRRHDIRYGRPLFGEPKGLMAHVHRKTPGNFCRCSLPPGEPFPRHPTCPPWSSNNSPRCSMSKEEIPLSQHDQLAMAIAQGRSVALWARDNQVPRSTAYRWASQPELRATVKSCRRRARDRALGRMAMQAQRASDQIAKLAAGAESESVKLRALRSILAGVISVSKFSDLRRRLAAIEQELHERT